jgi:hypothetical protein
MRITSRTARSVFGGRPVAWRGLSHTDLVPRKRAGPGDDGPCPICGEDMAEKVYEERLPTVLEKRVLLEVHKCRGRYWHMKNEHATMEDYWPPWLPAD